MQYIKINTTINLSSGLNVPSGSIVIIAEGYADIKAQVDGLIPAQISTFVFASYAAMISKKEAIVGIADFNTVFSFAKLTVENYETVPAESLLIGAVFQELALIYTEAKIEIIKV